MKIEGNTFIVTGGISGLGGAVTTKILELGGKVAAFDINAEKGEEFQKANKNCIFFQCDVTDEDSVAKAVQGAAEKLGNIRGVINCAGIGMPARVLSRSGKPANLKIFSKVLEINLIGTFSVLSRGAAEMAKLEPVDGERGVIVNTASVAAFDGQIGQAAYSASKGGVAAMTLPLARDLSRNGIRVCTIAPGIFETPMTDMMTPKMRESLNAQVPFPSRMGKPDEFSSFVVEIIRNSYFNGETIRLDGAIRMAAL